MTLYKEKSRRKSDTCPDVQCHSVCEFGSLKKGDGGYKIKG